MSAGEFEKFNEQLTLQGWFLSPEGLKIISDNGTIKDLRSITRNALDTDLKEIGRPILSEKLGNKCVDNVVLQVQKVRNISAPKANEDSQAAPRMLKISLTDGHAHCQAIEIDNIGGLSLNKTAPGTKILFKNVNVLNGFIFIKPEQTIVLGGKVLMLYEKWELNKNMSNFKRGDSDTDGPPAWVNFGKKISGSETRDFKSLEDKTSRDEVKNTEFDAQRTVAIAEATTGAIKKVFGGGTKPIINEARSEYARNRETREFKDYKQDKDKERDFKERPERDRNSKPERRNKREPREKNDVIQQKPSEKVSLFAFLEDKLPETPLPANPIPVQAQIGLGYQKTAPSYQNQRPGTQNNYKAANNYNNKSANNYSSNSMNTNNSYNDSYNSYNKFNNQPNRKPPRLQQQQQPQQHQYQTQNSKYQNSQPHSAPAPGQMDEISSKMDRLNVNASYAKNAFKQHLNLPQSNSIPAPGHHQRERNNDFGGPKLYKQPSQMQDNNFNANAVQSQNTSTSTSEYAWKWNVGDLCMAKYWEDNKYYNATVTELTNRTCVVRFNDYGNMEEVLFADCIPVTAEPEPEAEFDRKPPNSNQKFSNFPNPNGNEYRGNRNFVNRNHRRY